MELQIIYKSKGNTQRKVLVVVDKKSSISQIASKATDQFEKFNEFNNLKDLETKELYKYDQMTNTYKRLPMDGVISDYVTPSEKLHCVLESNQVWIKVFINMYSINHKVSTTTEIRISKSLTLGSLKRIILKTGLDNWNEFNMYDFFYYLVESHDFKLNNTICKIDDIPNERPLGKDTEGRNIDSGTAISEIFSFNGEITCTVHFISFEELIFNEIKSSKRFSLRNSIRLANFKSIEFDNLIKNMHFISEFHTLKHSIDRWFNTKGKEYNSSFYYYNKMNFFSHDCDKSVKHILVLLPNNCNILNSELKNFSSLCSQHSFVSSNREDTFGEKNVMQQTALSYDISDFKIGAKQENEKSFELDRPQRYVPPFKSRNGVKSCTNLHKADYKKKSFLRNPDVSLSKTFIEIEQGGSPEVHVNSRVFKSPEPIRRTLSLSKDIKKILKLYDFGKMIQRSNCKRFLCSEFEDLSEYELRGTIIKHNESTENTRNLNPMFENVLNYNLKRIIYVIVTMVCVFIVLSVLIFLKAH